MVDNKQLAEEMTFLFKYKDTSTDRCLYNTSLRKGATIGFSILVAIEVFFHIGLNSASLLCLNDCLYLYIILGSILRVAVIYYCYMAMKSNDFTKCLYGTYAIQITTLVQAFNTVVVLLAIILDMRIFGSRLWFGSMLPYFVLAILSICLNTYVSYIIFSFTKHLGLGNEDIINGDKLNALLPQPSCRSITTLVIGQNPSESDISYINTKGQFNALEKIVLNDPKDIVFAQSAQHAIINGMTLPSGVKIPMTCDSRNWKITGNEISLI
jgi:hypothetical protein